MLMLQVLRYEHSSFPSICLTYSLHVFLSARPLFANFVSLFLLILFDVVLRALFAGFHVFILSQFSLTIVFHILLALFVTRLIVKLIVMLIVLLMMVIEAQVVVVREFQLELLVLE